MVNIGIFDKEADVVEAIRLLREAGVDHDEMRIFVKNAEAAPLISSSTDVPVEEMAGFREGVADGWPVVAAIPTNNLGTGTAPSTPAVPGLVVGGLSDDGYDDGVERVLRNVGIPDHASERCGEEIEAGRILLYAEAEEDTSAETILRHAGAAEVLH